MFSFLKKINKSSKKLSFLGCSLLLASLSVVTPSYAQEKQKPKNLLQPSLAIKKTVENIPHLQLEDHVDDDGKQSVQFTVPISHFLYKNGIKRTHILTIKGATFMKESPIGSTSSTILKASRYQGNISVRLKLKDSVDVSSSEPEDKVTIINTTIEDGFLDLVLGGPFIEAVLIDSKAQDSETSSNSLLDLLREKQKRADDNSKEGQSKKVILHETTQKSSESEQVYPTLVIGSLDFASKTLVEENEFKPITTIVLPAAGVAGITYLIYTSVANAIQQNYEENT